MTLWRVRATVDDRPGFLAVLTASLALRSINILAVQVHTTEAGAVDDFLLDAPDNLDEADLVAAIERGRGRNAWVARTDAHGLVDAPAQIAGLAARLVADPEALGPTLSTMLGGCLVQHEEYDSVTGHGATSMRLADPAGGTIVLTRLAPAFTPAEFARAQALVEVARAAMTRRTANATVLLPGGEELTLRPAGISDLPGVRRLHARDGGPTDARLRRLLTPARGVALLAEDEHGQVVAMASLIVEGELAEAELVVQESMRRKGIGTALLRRLLALAGPLGVRAVEVHTRADNDDAMVHTVRRLRPQATFNRDGDLMSATLPVRDLVTAG